MNPPWMSPNHPWIGPYKHAHMNAWWVGLSTETPDMGTVYLEEDFKGKEDFIITYKKMLTEMFYILYQTHGQGD